MEKTVVIIHAVRKEGLDTEFYNMEYTLPDYKCRKTEDGVKEVFKKAVTAWLTTAEGEKAYEDTMHDFNWLDIPNYIPDSWMSFYGIEKIKTGDRLTIGNPAVIVIEVNADETFDQNLIRKGENYMNRINVYFDLDGTLAEWRAAASFSDLLKKGYFRSLAPTPLARYANELREKKDNVDSYTLSAYIPESYAHDEKNEWVDEYAPNIDPAHRIFVCDGVCKADFVIEALNRPLTENDVLVDDHTPNLTAWKKAGGKAIKWLNGINGVGGTFDGPRTGDIEELDHLIFG